MDLVDVGPLDRRLEGLLKDGEEADYNRRRAMLLKELNIFFRENRCGRGMGLCKAKRYM